MKKPLITAALLFGLTALPAMAQPVHQPKANPVPMQKTQVAGYFRQMVGDYEVTALYDGVGNLDTALMAKHTDLSEQTLNQLLDDAFVPRTHLGGMEGTIIGFLINTGRHLILIDAGKGEVQAPIFLDKQGRLIDSLRTSGYRPEQIDIILPTHMHADHLNGIVHKGKRTFKNATLYLAEQEKAFWLDTPINMLPETVRPYVELARQAVQPYAKAGRVKYYPSGKEIFENLTAIPLFGHTAGHSGFFIESKGEKLLIWGDLMHSLAIQMPHPEVAIDFDANAEQARKTRQTMLKNIVAEKTLIAGAHLPFPGLGHLQKDGEGYCFIPVQYRPLDQH